MSVAFCKRSTEVLFDYSTNNTVCTECRLVPEARTVDDTAEWRTFADRLDDIDNNPVRVGRLLTGNMSSPTRGQSRGSSSLILAFRTLVAMADRLGLVDTIKDRASEIYRKVEHLTKARNKDAVFAACLYIACRQEDRPRTVKEICCVANGATMKEIGRAKHFIAKQLEVEMDAVNAGDYLRRFCSSLGMTNRAVKATLEAVEKLEELDIRRSPISIAAAVIFIITQLSEEKRLLVRDILVATGVAVSTIRSSYRDLYPYASRLVPTWYGKDEDLRNLESP